jgi:putative iron-regulated protein
MRTLLTLLLAGLLAACEPTPKEAPPRAETGQRIRGEVDQFDIDPAFFQRGNQALAALVEASETLRQSNRAFLADSNLKTWQQLREDWLEAHRHWHYSSYFLASSDQFPASLPALTHGMRQLHAVPVTPGYIDIIPGYPNSGLISDITVELTPENLRKQHQSYSREEVAIGFHAMEFLLWGKQLSDYTEGREITQAEIFRGLTEAQLPTPRRRQYLAQLADLLVEDSHQLQRDWRNSPQRLGRLQAKQKRQLLAVNGIMRLQELLQSQQNHPQFSQDLSWQEAAMRGVEEGLALENFSLSKAIASHQRMRASSDHVTRTAEQQALNEHLQRAISQLQATLTSGR